MTLREQTEQRERETLSTRACLAEQTRGRARPEEPCGVRTCFQVDTDRIVYCKSFRRLKHKTQVFLQPEGDHYRTRMTHTLEVSRIARTIARGLALNEDLTEAIALGHDLGHTPFGHAGERLLNSIVPGGFAHFRQSLRVVERLEKEGAGLNLTWEVIDGIRNHKSAGMPATLEGQIVRLSDKIAYVNHDIDDAVRAGIMNEEELPKELRKVLGNSKRERLNTLTHDVIVNSMDKPKICMSEEVREALMELRAYMFTHVYENPLAKGEEDKAIRMVEDLYSYYETHMEKMPEQYLKQLQKGEMPEIAVCDYIAGMTDNFAVKKFEEIFIPQSWKF